MSGILYCGDTNLNLELSFSELGLVCQQTRTGQNGPNVHHWDAGTRSSCQPWEHLKETNFAFTMSRSTVSPIAVPNICPAAFVVNNKYPLPFEQPPGNNGLPFRPLRKRGINLDSGGEPRTANYCERARRWRMWRVDGKQQTMINHWVRLGEAVDRHLWGSRCLLTYSTDSPFRAMPLNESTLSCSQGNY
ncbi:unnamed protein product [Strongylus vulgaris]|uniref:Uncharacterized protein n=1 Tax=Strongylus vulgaris TaxID=40348 RepID=A0A3P7IM49_STRVU|nr:unnamed protein product [Strongylus vulgaris]